MMTMTILMMMMMMTMKILMMMMMMIKIMILTPGSLKGLSRQSPPQNCHHELPRRGNDHDTIMILSEYYHNTIIFKCPELKKYYH